MSVRANYGFQCVLETVVRVYADTQCIDSIIKGISNSFWDDDPDIGTPILCAVVWVEAKFMIGGW